MKLHFAQQYPDAGVGAALPPVTGAGAVVRLKRPAVMVWTFDVATVDLCAAFCELDWTP